MFQAIEGYYLANRAEQLRLLSPEELAELRRPSMFRLLQRSEIPSPQSGVRRKACRRKRDGAVQDKLPGF